MPKATTLVSPQAQNHPVTLEEHPGNLGPLFGENRPTSPLQQRVADGACFSAKPPVSTVKGLSLEAVHHRGPACP